MVWGYVFLYVLENILLLLTVLLFEYFWLELGWCRIADAGDTYLGCSVRSDDGSHCRPYSYALGQIPSLFIMDCSSFCHCWDFTFTTPDMGTTGKLVWAYVTYILMMTVYTAINVPYGAMLGVMTDDSNTKRFSSYRMFLHTEVVLSLWEHGSHCAIGLNQWTIAMLPVGNMPWYVLPRSAFRLSVLL